MKSYVAYLIKDNDVPMDRVSVMVLNPTLNTILVISWQPVLLVDETGVPCENLWPAASNWQTLSHNVVSSIPCH
jgi:hypothetical protein